MPLKTALATYFGKAVSKKLLDALSRKTNGVQRLEQASEAIARGARAIEALNGAFGDDFLRALNGVLGTSVAGRFSYEAGVASYIKADSEPASSPIAELRDELNINLDRICLLPHDKQALKNQFKGAFAVWKARYQELAPEHHGADAKATFQAIDTLLDDSGKTFKDVYKLTSSTALGSVGALMLISGVCLATGTGVGIVTAISIFLFGIPWVHVGTLVLPGVLMVLLAAMSLRDDQAMSACVRLAYGLLDRCATAKAHQQNVTNPSQTTTP